jgi:hypothetical protein
LKSVFLQVSISCMKSSIFDGLESRILELNVFVPCHHPKMDVELMYFTLTIQTFIIMSDFYYNCYCSDFYYNVDSLHIYIS